jgi:fructose-bisphosphate aldolase class I
MWPFTNQVATTIKRLLVPGKGILAADESVETIGRRFLDNGVTNTEANRAAYREVLFTTPDISRYISGAILFEETLSQKTKDGLSLVKTLHNQGVLVGIKVDLGLESYNGSATEKVTKGLDDLDARLSKYKALGAVFAKWRAVFSIGNKLPSEGCVRENADRLARYAVLCLKHHIVPIVEPEVLMTGTHTLEETAKVMKRVLIAVFDAFERHKVNLRSILLKPGMVLPGDSCPQVTTPQEIARATVDCFLETVPKTVPGIVFLSGGQTEAQACTNLSAIAEYGLSRAPWVLSFSFGRALQNATLHAWRGVEGHTKKAQEIFIHRGALASAATRGLYTTALEYE